MKKTKVLFAGSWQDMETTINDFLGISRTLHDVKILDCTTARAVMVIYSE